MENEVGGAKKEGIVYEGRKERKGRKGCVHIRTQDIPVPPTNLSALTERPLHAVPLTKFRKKT